MFLGKNRLVAGKSKLMLGNSKLISGNVNCFRAAANGLLKKQIVSGQQQNAFYRIQFISKKENCFLNKPIRFRQKQIPFDQLQIHSCFYHSMPALRNTKLQWSLIPPSGSYWVPFWIKRIRSPYDTVQLISAHEIPIGDGAVLKILLTCWSRQRPLIFLHGWIRVTIECRGWGTDVVFYMA